MTRRKLDILLTAAFVDILCGSTYADEGKGRILQEKIAKFNKKNPMLFDKDHQANNLWAFPNNFPFLLFQSTHCNKLAQEAISQLIYKGVLRIPQEKDRRERVLYNWLNETDPSDSFERKVARFFFKSGYTEDAEEILKEIQRRAHEGDAFAERCMGSCYLYTDILDNKDWDTAVQWYRKAAEKGNARAQMSLSLRYLQGMHVEKNITEGLKWLFLASEAGLPEAQSNLAYYYIHGINLDQDIKKGYVLCLEAAKGGDTEAQFDLAVYHMGISKSQLPVERNIQEGISWLKIAAESGDIEAMYLYGNYIYKEENVNEGLEWIRKATSMGHKRAKEFLYALKVVKH